MNLDLLALLIRLGVVRPKESSKDRAWVLSQLAVSEDELVAALAEGEE